MAVFSGNIFGSGGGGEGGTTDYNQLSHKPKINNVELRGNKTLEELGIEPEAIIYVNALPTTEIKENVIYCLVEEGYIYNNKFYPKNDTICYIPSGSLIVVDSNGITDTTTSTTYTWNEVTDNLITRLDSEVENFVVSDFVSDSTHFIKYGADKYNSALFFTETQNYQLYFYKYNDWHNIQEKVAIDNTTLSQTTTRADVRLVGSADIIKESEFITPKSKGIDIVLNTGSSPNPDIINDDPAYKYANNKTSSNNYINTRLDTIERKADAKTLTKFVDALPANPDINTEYYVETATPNVYDRYFVDSIGTVKEIGNTTMDVSTLATKVELDGKEDLSNKTTSLDDNSTDIQYPSAKSVVDYVKNSGGSSQIVETVLWQSPNGISGTGFPSGANLTLTDKLMNYDLFKFTVTRSNNFNNFYLTTKDIQFHASSNRLYTPFLSWDNQSSYLNVVIPTTTDTNILTIQGSMSCNLVNITGYKSIPMINTYSREIRETITTSTYGTTGQGSSSGIQIPLTKGISNFDYIEVYAQTADNNQNHRTFKIETQDLVSYYSQSHSYSMDINDTTQSRRWGLLWRENNTTLRLYYCNFKINKIVGIKAEPVVQGSPAYKQLYYNATGVSSGNITLNDDLSKFSYIEMISTGAGTKTLLSSKGSVYDFINFGEKSISVNMEWSGSATEFSKITYVNNTTVAVSHGNSACLVKEIIGWY